MSPADQSSKEPRNLYAAIRAIEYHLPSRELSNEELVKEFPGWDPAKIVAKTGIERRWLAADDQCASDLAVAAAQRLFNSGVCRPDEVDFLIFCTQSPDYLLPTSACLIQDRLGVPRNAGALDISLGCSGYVYGLSLAKGLIETGQAGNVMLLTGETYSKYMDPADFNVRVIFGDGASATLLAAEEDSGPGCGAWMGPFMFGTDGSGWSRLVLRGSGTRRESVPVSPPSDRASRQRPGDLYMDGPEIFSFTLKTVPQAVQDLLGKASMAVSDVDWFVFHQANEFMLEHLRQKIRIPRDKFLYALRDCGNTTSSSIPIVLKRAVESGQIGHQQTLMLVGFGVGYSWAGALLRWRAAARPSARGEPGPQTG